jgi:RNA 3'-terminal phosphate cyclase (ATP)
MGAERIEIDGSKGEGGGQLLRSALALSLHTGRPFRIEGIRAGRDRPGLLRQHLTAVQAAARIGGATVAGAELQSMRLDFTPGALAPGDYEITIGTAGSTTLVLQALLPPLLVAKGPSRLVLNGGTHNSAAPPFEFLEKTLAPLLRRMGARVELELVRPGFYPAGGGELVAKVEPAERLVPLELHERGDVKHRRAVARIANLPRIIAETELATVARIFDGTLDEREVLVTRPAVGPGNALLIVVECDHVTEVFTGFGERGRSSQQVARDAVEAAHAWLAAGVPVGPHLADQLLLPLAIAGGGSFTTLAPTQHALSAAEVIGMFLPVEIRFEEKEAGRFVVSVARKR